MREGTIKPSSAATQTRQPANVSDRIKLATLLAEFVSGRNTLKSAIDAMPDTCLTIRDRDYRLTFQSEPVLRLFGNRLGEKCHSVFEGKDDVCEGCPVALAFDDGQPHTSVREVVMPSGETAFWENVASPIRDAEGNISSCLEINVDITEVKRTEEALLEIDLRDKAMLAAMPDLMFGFSREGEILYYNAPDESDLYEEPEKFIGKRIDEVLPSDSGAKWRNLIERTLEAGQLQQLEYQLPLPKGVQDFEARMVISGPDEVLAIVRNITKRKQAEEKRRESEERFRSVTENAADAIFIKDMARRYTLVNPAMQAMLGLPKGDILGKTPEDIFGPEEAQTVREVDDRTFSGETVDETRILLLGSEEYYFHTRQTPLEMEDGEVTSIMGIVRDVTERKQAEKRDLHDGVGQQLAGLRFLLASLRQELSATHPEAAARVANIEQIAGDALTSARHITEGLERLSDEPDALVSALRKLARRASDLYGIQCRFTSRKPVLIQNLDAANQLLLIAQEAVANAVKHAKPSRIGISLSERNRRVRLAVRDDGVGFPRKKESKGMGLNIMRSRAMRIGASFDVKAGNSGGTVVTCSWKTPPPKR